MKMMTSIVIKSVIILSILFCFLYYLIDGYVGGGLGIAEQGDFVEVNYTRQELMAKTDRFLELNPEYQLPEYGLILSKNDTLFDSWEDNGHGFKTSKFLLLKDEPRQVYYITIVSNPRDIEERGVELSFESYYDFKEKKWISTRNENVFKKPKNDPRFENIVNRIKEIKITEEYIKSKKYEDFTEYYEKLDSLGL